MEMQTATLALSLLRGFPPLKMERELSRAEYAESIVMIGRWINACQQSWLDHPQYADMGGDAPHQAQVMMVFRHKPGVNNSPYSFVMSGIDDLVLAYSWATKTRIGDFQGVYPLDNNLYCDPNRIGLYSFTHEGKGKSYHARMELKRMLPPKLRSLVSKHRRARRISKLHYLTEPLICNDMIPFVTDMTSTTEGVHRIQNATGGAIKDWLAAGVELPDWYASRTKRDLWGEALKTRDPQLHAELMYWMGDACNFYDAVIGAVEPNEIKNLFIRRHSKTTQLPKQLALF
jgi:hypothetical protein